MAEQVPGTQGTKFLSQGAALPAPRRGSVGHQTLKLEFFLTESSCGSEIIIFLTFKITLNKVNLFPLMYQVSKIYLFKSVIHQP